MLVSDAPGYYNKITIEQGLIISWCDATGRVEILPMDSRLLMIHWGQESPTYNDVELYATNGKNRVFGRLPTAERETVLRLMNAAGLFILRYLKYPMFSAINLENIDHVEESDYGLTIIYWKEGSDYVISKSYRDQLKPVMPPEKWIMDGKEE